MRTRLVLPLLVLSGFAVFLHMTWAAGGFFINVATDLVGIVITVAYVDWILRRHEERRWRATDQRIANRLRIYTNSVVSSIRTGLGIGTDVFDIDLDHSVDVIAIHKEVMRVGEHVIAPSLRRRVAALDEKAWKSLSRQITNLHNGTLTMISALQARLTLDQLSDLLDLQEALQSSLWFYSTFPDIAGVSSERLPETRTPPELLQRDGCDSTAKELEKTLQLAKSLAESVAGIDLPQTR